MARERSTGGFDDVLAYLRTNPVEFVQGRQHECGRRYCPSHRHPTLEIVYHVHGSGETRLGDGRSLRFRRHGVVLYGPLEAHDQRMTSAGTDACIHLRFRNVAPPLVRATRHVPLVEDARLRHEMERLANVPAADSPSAQAVLDHQATALLIQLIDHSDRSTNAPASEPSGRRHAEAAYDVLNQRFATLDRVEHVAEELGVSYHYLRHAFGERYGCAMRRCLIAIRLEHARHLLRLSPLPQKTISRMCGFRNERYFSTSFRRGVGCTPGAYRRVHALGAGTAGDAAPR